MSDAASVPSTPGQDPVETDEDFAADERPEPSVSTEPFSYTTEPAEPTD